MSSLTRIAAAAITALAAAGAQAGGYTEGADLSGNYLAPTPVTVTPGSNIVKGTMGYRPDLTFDVDFFTITVPVGYELSGLVLGQGTQIGGGASFIGMVGGSSFPTDPAIIQASGTGITLLGWHIYTSAEKGTSILDEIGGGPDKIGFSGSLGAGSYSFWVQELASPFPGEPFPPFPYELDFQISAVPEPGTLALWAAGLVIVGARVRQRRG